MIYWFIGQPCCGKTTLAKLLATKLRVGYRVLHLDGDDLRKIFGNDKGYATETFTKEWRNEQTRILQKLVRLVCSQGIVVIVSTVNPYRDVREEFKNDGTGTVVEIYVHKTDIRERESFNAPDFEPPSSNFVSVNTTGKTPEESLKELCQTLAI